MSRYAIIRSGSKQYRVSEGDEIDVELLADAEKNGEIEFQDVLYVFNGEESKVGAPLVDGAIVKAEILKEKIRGPKVVAYKYKKRKSYHRKVGHRQNYTRVKITEV